jgi:hypothetical protein
LNYALAKQIPDMARGFVVATSYGSIIIDAEDSAPVIKALTKMLEHKLAKLSKQEK